ncbi:hypothetical protein LNP74_20335 [Klebsiella pneumoniae subsp. pneumoniae]|nr:hypothetical protein [Klebsiella pneumoniae subsp. pneumoniae]
MENAYRQMQMNAQADKVAKDISPRTARTPEPDSSNRKRQPLAAVFLPFPDELKRFSAGLTHQIWPALSGSTSKISLLPALSHKMNLLTKVTIKCDLDHTF